jgi:ribosomal protein L11
VYFLKQAAGISRGGMTQRDGKKQPYYATNDLNRIRGLTRTKFFAFSGECVGKVTRKHIYEIAKIKHKDPPNKIKTMFTMCCQVIATAKTIGIQVSCVNFS